MKQLFNGLIWWFVGVTACQACIWDADTLASEKKKKPSLAQIILNDNSPASDHEDFASKISKLRQLPRTNDPSWYNDLAGAYLRSGHPNAAVELLTPVLNRFEGEYGIHANLGTAYHLLGRFSDAEKEIARDLEINPDAHFGLEKFHLALLQYLCRDDKYQFRHIYVDEFTEAFLLCDPYYLRGPEQGLATSNATANVDRPSDKELEEITTKIKRSDATSGTCATLTIFSDTDDPPAYRFKWNLANDPKLEEGLRYMATLNSQQPACFVMLGVFCLKNSDLNLAAAAFEKAVRLGSVQSPILKLKAAALREYIHHAQQNQPTGRHSPLGVWACASVAVIFVWIGTMVLRKRLRKT